MYKLTRSKKGESSNVKSEDFGDSGGMSRIFKVVEGEEVEAQDNARPTVGFQIRVGSLYARTMQWQDWIQTSPVAEIIEDAGSYVIFRTKSGSIYRWEIDNA